MQLYSIEYDKLAIVSQFDGKGRKTGEYEHRVRVTMNDLPFQTAQMYREKMDGLNVVITAQARMMGDEPRKRSSRDHVTYDRKPNVQASAAPKSTREDRVKKAAASGDMAAAINED